MANSYAYFKGDQDFIIKAFSKYAHKKQEMDKLLEKLIAPYIANQQCKILDAGCGVGFLCQLLSVLSPRSSFVGIDQMPFLIAEAKKLYPDEKRFTFAAGDVEDLPGLYSKAFDVSVSRAVISWVPYYEEFMRSLAAVTKKHIFISSLFYDGDIDFITQVREFKKEAGKTGFSEYRNVYSLPHFKEYMYTLGARNIEAYDFNIGIDLPKGDPDILGTYTEHTLDGRRLQISGAVVMSWKWVRIDF